MDELALTMRAKSYIDMLANGIDPIGGNELPADSALNQLPVTRCFFFVSDLLRQVIDNGGQIGRKKPAGKKADFSLAAEQRERFACSETPLPVSQLVDRINQLIDPETTKKLPLTAVTGWLEEKGFLQAQADAFGKTRKTPTEQGAGIGITAEQRQGKNGLYLVVLYHETAQRFVLDHLEEITARSYAK